MIKIINNTKLNYKICGFIIDTISNKKNNSLLDIVKFEYKRKNYQVIIKNLKTSTEYIFEVC